MVGAIRSSLFAVCKSQLRANWDLETAVNFVDLRQAARTAASAEPPAEEGAPEEGQAPGKAPSRDDKAGRKPPRLLQVHFLK